MGKNIIICSLILILSFSLLTLSSTDLKAEQEGQITDQALILNHNNTQTRATLLDNLLGHFVLTREKINADNLKTISLSKFDYIFYLTGNNRIDTRILAILKKFQGTICLIGPAAVNLYFPENSITIPVGNNNYIEYNEKELTLKNDISITTIKTASSQTTASDLTIETSIYHNQKEYPFIFHRENKWFIPHLDFWDSSQLIFADLLHNILQQEHRRSKKVFIRIEDIHPRSDPEKIKKLADIFISRELPFAVNVIPVYQDPDLEGRLPLDFNPELVEVLHYIQKNGGSVIMHGYTHCLPDGKSSGEGYEFWNTEQDSFITNVDFISKRIILGLKQFKKQGILPAAFCPPHYAFPHDGYRILKDYLPVLVGQKQINNTIDMMQDFPFLINEDEQGLTIIPENLGYVTDRKDIDQIINNARRLTVIRDGTASFFYHWFMPPEYLESLVDWFQFNGYQFVDLDNYQKTRPKFNKQLLLNTKDNKLIKPPHYWVKMALEIIAGFCLIIILYALILFCYKKLNQGGD